MVSIVILDTQFDVQIMKRTDDSTGSKTAQERSLQGTKF